MDIFANLYNVIFRPKVTFGRLAKEYSIGLTFQGLLVFLIANSIHKELSTRAIVDSFLTWLTIITLIFLIGFVFKLRADDFFKIVCLCSFANAPLIFSAPLRLINDYHEGLSSWLRIGLWVWVFSLNVLAISKAFDISKRRVVLFFSIPIIGAILLISGSIFQILLFF